MKIFNGKKAAQKILKETGEEIKKHRIKPVLAAISVGDDEASKLYLKLKKEAAVKIGIEVREFIFDKKTLQADIIEKIKELNVNS